MRAQIGMPRIYSMSSKWDITQMWSYYADAHKGFCLELRGLENSGVVLDRVNYTDRRAQVTLDDIISLRGNSLQSKRTVSSIFYEKSNSWREEVEYRLVAREDSARERRHLSLPSGDFYTFPEVSLDSITFGLRCDPRNVEFVRDIVRSSSRREVPLLKVSQATDSYDLSRASIDERSTPSLPPMPRPLRSEPGAPSDGLVNLLQQEVKKALSE